MVIHCVTQRNDNKVKRKNKEKVKRNNDNNILWDLFQNLIDKT